MRAMHAHAAAASALMDSVPSQNFHNTCIGVRWLRMGVLQWLWALSQSSPISPSQFKAVKPVGDRVLVKVDKQEMKSIGGVLLPANAAKKPTAGSIVAMGDVSLVKVRRN
jgi:hypothetical protein